MASDTPPGALEEAMESTTTLHVLLTTIQENEMVGPTLLRSLCSQLHVNPADFGLTLEEE